LEFKIYVPGFYLKWLNGEGNSVLADIRWIRSVRDRDAAVLLLAIENDQNAPDFKRLGIPTPYTSSELSIPLGKTQFYPSYKAEAAWARFYVWTNAHASRKK
jgi:hypothetical protein